MKKTEQLQVGDRVVLNDRAARLPRELGCRPGMQGEIAEVLGTRFVRVDVVKPGKGPARVRLFRGCLDPA